MSSRSDIYKKAFQLEAECETLRKRAEEADAKLAEAQGEAELWSKSYMQKQQEVQAEREARKRAEERLKRFFEVDPKQALAGMSTEALKIALDAVREVTREEGNAERDRLRAALQPFADAWKEFKARGFSPDHPLRINAYQSDFAAAANVLEGKPPIG